MKWVYVDVSYLAHRAKNAIRKMSHEEFPTGVIFGFFEQLRTTVLLPEVQSNRLLLFFDSRHSVRRKEYPEYKRARKQARTPEEVLQTDVMHKQMNVLSTHWLRKIGFACYRQCGLESDDLIHSAVTSSIQEPGIIITSDGDLFQSIQPSVSWYDPQRKKHVTYHSFLQDKGIKPSDWALVKELAGCASDNVSGIPGVGEKTALKYLRCELSETSKSYIEIEKRQDVRDRNRTLVKLPHASTRPVRPVVPRYDLEAFVDMCREFGIESYLKGERGRQWNKILRGVFQTQRARKRGGLCRRS